MILIQSGLITRSGCYETLVSTKRKTFFTINERDTKKHSDDFWRHQPQYGDSVDACI